MKNPLRKMAVRLRQLKEAYLLVQSAGHRFLRAAPPGHFYSPIPDYDEIRNRDYKNDQKLKEIPGIDLKESHQLELVESFAEFYRELPWKDHAEGQTLRYYYDNIYFSYGDVITLYSVMRKFKPKRIIEIGSGYSSAAMLDVDGLFFNGSIQFTFIDPHPERLRSLVPEKGLRRYTVVELPAQQVDVTEFEKLGKGDILFIDSSHVSKTGSDVNYLIHKVLPVLKTGVIIHFHDILWPFEYPKKWLKAGRVWNEAYLLRAFLQYNSSFEVLFFNSFLEQHHRKYLREKMPLMLRQPASKMTFGNSSLWLRRV